jgi:hypothetical protein
MSNKTRYNISVVIVIIGVVGVVCEDNLVDRNTPSSIHSPFVYTPQLKYKKKSDGFTRPGVRRCGLWREWCFANMQCLSAGALLRPRLPARRLACSSPIGVRVVVVIVADSAVVGSGAGAGDTS